MLFSLFEAKRRHAEKEKTRYAKKRKDAMRKDEKKKKKKDAVRKDEITPCEQTNSATLILYDLVDSK